MSAMYPARSLIPWIPWLCGAAVFCACQPYEAFTPPRLASPTVTDITLSEAVISSSYREAIHITWTPPRSDSIGIRSYTIIRKTSSDSLFDVFTRSQGIPASITAFNDDATLIGFPLQEYTLVSYKLFAIDSLGRTGDTSVACTLYLARQPALDTIDQSLWCLHWHSQFIMGSIKSYVKLWNGPNTVVWTSTPVEGFGSENLPLNFDACLPASLKPLASGTWYFALHLEAMGREHQSLKIGTFNVP